MPKVSICIPCYKQTEYLGKCLNSVFMQEFTDYEIIITDDTPDDSVKDFLDKNYKNKNIQYFKNHPALGTPENWNCSLKKGSGTYLKLLHHDDFFTQKNSLQKFVKLLDKNPKASLAFCGTEVWNVPSGKKWIHSCSAEQAELLKRKPEFLFFRNLIGAPSATIIRKEVADSYDTRFKWLVDIDYYIRVIKKSAEIAYTKEALICTADNTAGQVTQDVIHDKQIQISEHVLLFSKLTTLPDEEKNYILYFDELFTRFGIKNIADLNSLCKVPESHNDFYNKVFNQLGKNTLYKALRNWFYGSRFNNHIFKLEKYS